jgi:hypothetical protein
MKRLVFYILLFGDPVERIVIIRVTRAHWRRNSSLVINRDRARRASLNLATAPCCNNSILPGKFCFTDKRLCVSPPTNPRRPSPDSGCSKRTMRFPARSESSGMLRIAATE